MQPRWASRLQLMRRSKAYLMFASAHLMTVGVCAYGMFHSVLPYYLRDIHENTYQVIQGNTNGNVSYVETNAVNMNEQIGKDIGVITGTGAGGQLFMSILAGYILKRFSLRINWILGSLFFICAIVLAIFADDVIMMCASNVFVSTGYLWLYETLFSYHGDFTGEEKVFNFLIGWSNMFNSIGFLLGYSAVAAAYQFFGRRSTFGVLLAMFIIDLVIRLILPPLTANEMTEITLPGDDVITDNVIIEEQGEEDMVDEADDEDDDHYNDLGCGSILLRWWRFMRDPMVLLVTFQTIAAYICGSIMWSSAPNYLANYIQAQQWQTGLIMGLGQGLGLLTICVLTFITTTHNQRIVTLMICVMVLSAACIAYPFTNTVWTALIPDVMFRASRDALVTLIITLIPYVATCQQVGDTRMSYSLYGFCVSIGTLIGCYGSGILVATISFKWLYIGMGISMFLTSFTFIPYFRLKTPSDMKVSVSMKDIHNSVMTLTLPSLAMRRSRSNFGSLAGSLAKSRSRMSDGSDALIRSKYDVNGV